MTTATDSPLSPLTPPEHGGRLRQAAARLGIPLAQWLDLSTGVNPHNWQVPLPPESVWQRLPEDDDGLESAAAQYYGAAAPLPLAGSQAAIQVLPTLRQHGRVGVPAVGYQEHAHAWRRAGHQVIELSDADLSTGRWLADGSKLDCLIVINPNNPTGRCWPVATLLDWQQRLAARGGWLIVDEAFMDVTPSASLLPSLNRPGLIVLRSLGKFFGLAGARVGFLFADKALQTQVAAQLGPWTVAGASRWVATQALTDTAWQMTTRAALPLAAARLANLLTQHGLAPSGGTALFQWVMTEHADCIAAGLAQQGILVRYFAEPASVRFGLPGHEREWQRLKLALAALRCG